MNTNEYKLYVKTHNVTGLKYLGYTKENPLKYKGSGKEWKQHLKENGNNVNTIVLHLCKNKKEIEYYGRYYSELWNIVESLEWANKIPETSGGGNIGQVRGEKHYRYDHTVYSWQNIHTLEIVHMTRRDFTNKYNMGGHAHTLLSKQRTSYRGWRLWYEGIEPYVHPNTDTKQYCFQNALTKEKVILTQSEFKTRYNIKSTMSHLIHGKRKSLFGWRIVNE